MNWTRRTRGRASWALTIVSRMLRKHVTMPFQSVSVRGTPRRVPVRVLRDVMVPMRDGVRLCSDIYMPKQEGKYPAILTRLPYGKSEWYCGEPVKGRFWASRGYAYVVQDVRGKHKSEGRWEPFVNEVNDGYDSIDWISKQPWSNGRIGMSGISYFGYTSLAAAVSGHPALICAAPRMTAADIYGVWMYKSGAFCMQTMGSWLIGEEHRKEQNDLLIDYWHLPLLSLGEAAGLRDSHFRACIEHHRRDDYWARINLNGCYEKIRIPMLHMGGWYDVFLKGTVDDWTELCLRGDDKARGNQWLVIGPDDHESSPLTTGRIGQVRIGEDRVDHATEVMAEFFDYWLKGADNGFEKSSRVKIFVIGDNIWRNETSWPLGRMRPTEYYMHSRGRANSLMGDGSLSTEAPTSEPSDTYLYDPADPVRQSLDEDLWYLAKSLKDRSRMERRSDVLVYSSDLLTSDLEMTGPISLRLFASSTSDETDFVAKLVDVFPDGYGHMIQEGIFRINSAQSNGSGKERTSDDVFKINLDLAATSYVIRAGHRIRLEVCSSDFNRYDRNLNMPGEYGRQTRFNKARQTVYHDSARPSRIVIPVIPR
jgi:putative CocE/NonD family hydrolase